MVKFSGKAVGIISFSFLVIATFYLTFIFVMSTMRNYELREEAKRRTREEVVVEFSQGIPSTPMAISVSFEHKISAVEIV